MNKINLSTIFVFLLISTSVLAEDPSQIKINSLVNDYGNVFTAEEEIKLNSILKNIYDSETAEVSIVTVKSLNGYESQDFAQKISEGNLGNSETNNGLLLLISVEDRKYWFNVGRGLEHILNDGKVGRIGREFIVPYFRQNLYFDGSVAAIIEIANELNIKLTNEVAIQPISKRTVNPMLIFMVFFFLMSIIRSINANVRGKGGKGKHGNDDGFFLAAMLASSLMRGGRGGGFGGSGGFGGFGGGGFGGSGGFGGFGGGGFGGGGAGGGW